MNEGLIIQRGFEKRAGQNIAGGQKTVLVPRLRQDSVLLYLTALDRNILQCFEFNFFFNGTQLYCHIFGINDKGEFILLIVSCNIRPSAGYDLFGENPKQIDNVALAQNTVFFSELYFWFYV